MIDVLFNRLSEETNQRQVLVKPEPGISGCRHGTGLSEDEMLDVLGADDAVWAGF